MIVWQHLKLNFLQLLRQPSYILSTLFFPSLFFLIFARPNADSLTKANFLLGSFSAFAVLGVIFFDFGVSISRDRETQWMNYIRTLPIRGVQIFLARTLNALLFSLVASALVCIVVQVSSVADISFKKQILLFLVLVIGSIPFALMALSIGFTFSTASALPVCNLIYITLSFAGGLWLPPNALPLKVQEFSTYLPTRFYGEMVWSLLLEQELATKYLWSYMIYLCAGVLLTWLSYRRALS